MARNNILHKLGVLKERRGAGTGRGALERLRTDVASALPSVTREQALVPVRLPSLPDLSVGGRGKGDERTANARLLNGGAAVLALAVLADSSVEHYRGMFFNKAMFTPLVTSTLTLAASLHGVNDLSPSAERKRDTIYSIAALTGLVGTGFHFYNVGKREGGFAWVNLFYGAPLGAPFALLLSGLLGFSAERVRAARPGKRPKLFGFPEARALAAVSAMGLMGTVGEVGLLHFRGAYHDPFMFLPVTMPPVAAGLMAAAAVDPTPRKRPFTRAWLWLTGFLGFAGMGFHAYGVSRNMGGWRNWRQNVLNGPPIPAPPSFTGLAMAGLAALRLMEKNREG